MNFKGRTATAEDAGGTATERAITHLARRVTLWGGAFLVIASCLGLLNKVFIADPITRATEKVAASVAAERISRERSDSLMVQKIAQINVSSEQLQAAVEVATYSKAQIDRMKWEADQEHKRLETLFWTQSTVLRSRIELLEQTKGR
jgi:hypothetical protein